ncbi:mucin-2 isoform X2 [Dipodomys merriami]|uniref:mucin-2 isoform X2 n=1 Tax=Dipodomys merriami TaxID=94247 RepID=UPI0038559D27
MGWPLARLVAVCLALTLARGSELQRGRPRNHGHNVCSTWGAFHYKTFDGDVFRFPGLCDYNFASDCRDAYKEFAVHLRRGAGTGGTQPRVESILLTIKDDAIYLTHQLVVVNGAMVSTPHYSSGLLIEKNDAYTKVYSRAGLTLMWNREDAVMLELDSRFQNHTCGLCGDYNGLQTYSEFLSEGIRFSALEFGNMQKINRPGVPCEDPEEEPAPESCSEHRAECERLLTAAAFEDCQARVPVELYVRACMQDRCRCPPGGACECSTVAEFSRQCSHAGGQPGSWRTDSLCPKSCPGNMIYLESGSPCMDTCSHLEVSSLCEEHRMDGCFCPEGTVYDDITGGGCVPVSQCHCRLHGRLYTPGQEVSNECEQCLCHAGRWVCKDLPCPGTCTLEGGAHISTFDGKKFTFHGDCYYVLTKGEHNDSYALLGELAPCGSTDKQTCLKTVVLLTDKNKNVVAFKSDGSVLLNEMEVTLPHVAASFAIFQPSSYHIVVNTAFGLRLQVQLVPVMQLFVTLDQASQGQVQGLCGNFNGLESDDFMTSGGLVEATGAGFANTWKAQTSCHDKPDWLDDPCSLNIESANYAEHWCSLLRRTETPFGKCHLAVDPTEYYKRCKYDTCNCQNNEDCLCAALSSYARACAAKGVMLWGWRERVCNKDVDSCPTSQVFLYNLTTCQQTCRSLSDGDTHCLKGFAPVDGCGCPDRTFLDEKGRCVPLAKCSCYHHGLYLEAGEVILRQEERCVCQNGRLNCRQVKLLSQSCRPPKALVDCNNLTAPATQSPRPRSCQALVAGYYHTECVSGCVCPGGLLDDGRGGCVPEEACPCMHNKDLYLPGDQIKMDCNNTCTCQRGRWACTQYACHGTCSIYGSGHYITFDGKHYDFDGHCSYVAVQDYCGQNSTGSFSIITENVPCGTTGVTCSKAIKIFIGGTELKLEDRHRVVKQLEEGGHVAFLTREVGQYLVVEASTGIILIWDKKTTLFIRLAPSYKGAVCGLCGNFDGRTNNDFTTRDHMVVSSELDFGNSWKEASTCPDVSSTPDPCSANPHRRSWAEKQCSIIKSRVFSGCHSKVDPTVFYEACVHDSCSCDSGGDCDCFCSAVASYAQECTKAEACVFWRTPDLCPIFCDYYNPPDECEWHYEPCGNRSFETCRTINGIHSNISVSYLEGCYPRCPQDRPIYDEDLKKCVSGDQCGCYIEDTHYPPGAPIPSEDICMSCTCTDSSQITCQPDEGKVVNQTQDGVFCFWDICGPNGTVEHHFNICVSSTRPPSSTPTTAVTTSFTTPTPLTTTTPTPTSTPRTVPSTTPHCCLWSDWVNKDHPESGSDGGDHETFTNICPAPEDIECRPAAEPHLNLTDLQQKVYCNVTHGFACKNEEQSATPFNLCYDYEIRVKCCWPEELCVTSTSPTTATTRTTTTTTTTTPTTPPTSTPPTPTTSPTPTTPPTSTSTTSPTPTPTPTPTTPPTSTSTTTPTPTPTPTPTTPPTSTSTTTPTPTPTPTTPPTSTSTTSPTSTTPPTSTSTTTPTPTPTPTTPPTSTSTTTPIPTPTPTTPPTSTSTTTPTPTPTPTTPPTSTSTTTPTPTTPPTSTSTTTPTPTTPPTSTSTTTPTPTPTPTTPPTSTSTTSPTPTTPPTSTSTTSPTPTSTSPPTSTSTTSPTPTTPPTSTSTTSPTPTTPPTSTSTTSPTPTSTSPPTSTSTISSTPTATTSQTTCVPDCKWTGWWDSGKLYPNGTGDFELVGNVCEGWALNISCRAVPYPSTPIEQLGQTVVCDPSIGLVCKNEDQEISEAFPFRHCLNYEINVYCCECAAPTSTSTWTPTTTSTTSTPTPTPTTPPTSTSTTSTPTPTPTTPPTSTSTTPPTPPTTTPPTSTSNTSTPTPTPTTPPTSTSTTSSTPPTTTPPTSTSTTSTPTPTPTTPPTSTSTTSHTPTPTPTTPPTSTSTTSTLTPTPTTPPTSTSTTTPTPTPTPTTPPTSTSTTTPTPTTPPTSTSTTSPTPTPTPTTPPTSTSTTTPTPTPTPTTPPTSTSTTSPTPTTPPTSTSTTTPTPTPTPTTPPTSTSTTSSTPPTTTPPTSTSTTSTPTPTPTTPPTSTSTTSHTPTPTPTTPPTSTSTTSTLTPTPTTPPTSTSTTSPTPPTTTPPTSTSTTSTPTPTPTTPPTSTSTTSHTPTPTPTTPPTSTSTTSTLTPTPTTPPTSTSTTTPTPTPTPTTPPTSTSTTTPTPTTPPTSTSTTSPTPTPTPTTPTTSSSTTSPTPTSTIPETTTSTTSPTPTPTHTTPPTSTSTTSPTPTPTPTTPPSSTSTTSPIPTSTTPETTTSTTSPTPTTPTTTPTSTSTTSTPTPTPTTPPTSTSTTSPTPTPTPTISETTTSTTTPTPTPTPTTPPTSTSTTSPTPTTPPTSTSTTTPTPTPTPTTPPTSTSTTTPTPTTPPTSTSTTSPTPTPTPTTPPTSTSTTTPTPTPIPTTPPTSTSTTSPTPTTPTTSTSTTTPTPTPTPTTPPTSTSTTSPTPTTPPTSTSTTSPTPTSTSPPTSTSTISSTPTATTSQTTCVPDCKWTGWWDSGKLYPNGTGDFELVGNVCEGWALNISCRAVPYPSTPIEQLGQTVVCDPSIGLVCKNEDQEISEAFPFRHCLNYEINVYCCECAAPTSTSTWTPTTTSTTSTPTPTPTTPPTSTSTTSTPTPTPTTPPTSTSPTSPTPTPTPTTPPTSTSTTSTPTPTTPPTSTFTTSPTPTPTPTTPPTSTSITSPTLTPTIPETTTSTTSPTPTPTPTTPPTSTSTTSPTPTPTPTTPPTSTSTTSPPTPTPTTPETTTSTTSPTPTPTPTTPTSTSTTSPTPTPTIPETTTSTTSPTPTPTPTTPPTSTSTTSPPTPTPTTPETTTSTTSATPTPTPTTLPTSTSTTSPSTPTPTTPETTTSTTSHPTPTPTPTTPPTSTSTTSPPTPTPTTPPTSTSTTSPPTPTPTTPPTSTSTTSPPTPTPTTPPTSTSTTSPPTPTPTTPETTTSTTSPTPTPTPTTPPTSTSSTSPPTPTPTTPPTSTSTTSHPTPTPTMPPTSTSTTSHSTPTPTPTTPPTSTSITSPPTPTPTTPPTSTSTTSHPTPTPTPTTPPTSTSTTSPPTPTPTTPPTSTSTTSPPTPTPTTPPTSTSTTSPPTPTPTTPETTTSTTSPTPTPTPTTPPTSTSTTSPTPTPTIPETTTSTTSPTPTPTPTTPPTSTSTTSHSTPTPTPTTLPTSTSTTSPPTPTPTTPETTTSTTSPTPTPTPTTPPTSTSTTSPTPTPTIPETTTSTTSPTPTPTPTTPPTSTSTTSPTPTPTPTPTTPPTSTSTTSHPTPTLTTPETTTSTTSPIPTPTPTSPPTSISTSPTPTPTPTTPSTSTSTTSATPTPTVPETTTVTTSPTPRTTTPPTSTPSTPKTATLTSPTSTATTTGTPSSKTTPTGGTPTESSASTPRPPSTASPPPSTPRTTSTTGTVSPLTSPSTSWVSSATQITCCVLDEMFYGPGEVIYNKTSDGNCYHVNCSTDCVVYTTVWPCPSTPAPPSTPPTSTPTPTPSTPTPTPSTTTSPSTPPPPDCPDFDPPRQVNETWWLCECYMATCKYNNTVEIEKVECNPPPKPTCSNGLPPVRVEDPDHCCWHWECDCYCTGWGDPHYMTFDGLYYSYQGNCTYVLVEEISPTVDNFGVYIDNYHCDINDKVSCPRTLIVRHETQEVLIKTTQMTPIKMQVQVNKQAVALPFKKYGVQVYESGINFVVNISRLGALISYNGLSFSIRLPYQLFGNNTKGQCGTCTNNTADDCVLPSGEVISDCELAADQWVVNDPSKPHCPHAGSTTGRPSTTTSGLKTPRPKDCPGSPLCQLIKDSLFAPCHAVVPPQHYYEACVFDSCFVPHGGLECASVQIYAALCAQEGVCIAWRNHTGGACPMACPAHREYQACGPMEEPTCQSSPIEQESPSLVEGCFCPKGTINYAPGFDVCVKTCGCMGPDNVPREFGEHFTFDCKDCVCLEGGRGIVCQPHVCSQRGPSQCTEDGTYLVTEVNPADTCCSISSCRCNTSLCREEPPACLLGFEVKRRVVPGRCCPVYSCVPKGVCVHQNAEYQPGSPVYSSKCEDCVCTHAVDNSTQFNVITCTHVPCNSSCSPGFDLVDVPGECCKKCQQTQCVVERPNGQFIILEPGETQANLDDKCTFFSCTKINNQLTSFVSKIMCPEFDSSSCVPGSITFMPNGCCKTCIPRNETAVPCSTIPVTKEISQDGCAKNVSMNYCSGSCGTFAMYSAHVQSLDHKCSCCKEDRTSQRQVILDCPDGRSLAHTYTHIESCLCQDTVCALPQPRQSRARRSSPQLLGRK